ncbi:hypothetical protein ABFT23_03245 [Nocardioides sp. C4-1]|uniref:hypothetical protein n=1 Tax=Nocardioides sp. C4-1 TaxID=3151851 RepID=UPI00326674DC
MSTPYDGFLDAPSTSASPFVGTLRLPDTDLPGAPSDVALRVVVTGGAGQVAGPLALAARRELRLVALETSLRDDADPAANARRVVAACDAGGLPADVRLHVGVWGEPTPSWLAAADEVAAVDGALCLDLASTSSDGLAGWIDAALDREVPFSLRGGGVDDAVAALAVTARLWGDAGDLDAARRWCRSWACDDLDAAEAHLRALTT